MTHITNHQDNFNNKSGFGGKPKFDRNGDGGGFKDRNSFGNDRKSFGNDRGGNNNTFEKREGDWDCEKCHRSNFAFRTECKFCNTGKDGTPGKAGQGGKPGDWICSKCSNDNFAFRTECKRCGAGKDGSEGTGKSPGGGFGARGGGRGGRGGRGGFDGGRGRGGRGGFDGGRGRGGRGGSRGGFSGDRKSFGGFDAKPENKKITFGDE